MLARQIKVTLLVMFVFLSLLLSLSLLSGCKQTESTGSIMVWLDVPIDGLVFSDLQDLNIKGHAEAKDSVSSVEIWVNGALLATISEPPAEAGLAGFNTKWTPDSPGDYTIQVIAFGADGTASQPDSVRVTFGKESAELQDEPALAEEPEPEEELPPVSEPPATETKPTEPEATIQFWADPPIIAAGDCTTIRWQVENAGRVIFGDADQPLSGSYRACLCDDQVYSLRVFNLDGTEEHRTLEVRVTGSCETPQPTPPPPAEPAPDTTPPPAPTPAVPADGLSIACKAAQSMAWLPVSDPSGIIEYRVEVQRQSGDNNWQPAPGGSLSGLQVKEATVSVECGWYYRWRVRAVDGAGNVSPWSGWSHFAMLLM
jgi:hypothetical protein